MREEGTEQPTADGPHAGRPQTAPGGRGLGTQSGHGSKSDVVRERAIVALLAERTIGAAARRAGVGERTLRRWLTEDEAFQADLAAARAAAFDGGITRVQALMGRAVDTLEALLGAKKHPHVRLGAARTVAELAIHHHEAATILRRLEELERYQRGRRELRRR